VLVDFGFTPEVLNNNMAIIGIDLSRFDAVVLSHGHYDHFGGMIGFLEKHGRVLKKEIPFYLAVRMLFAYAASGRLNLEHSTARLFWIPA
jgi:metal-dependent hydrolase (beta-lactamase superfamily II)